MSSVPNLGAALGNLPASLDGNTYAANERAGWARDDFSSLFEQQLRMSESRAEQSGAQAGMDQRGSGPDPGLTDAEIEPATATGMNVVIGDGSISTISAADLAGLEQPAVDLDGQGMTTGSVREPVTGAGSQSDEWSTEAPAASRIQQSLEPHAPLPQSSVTVHLEDGVVAACIRNAGMDEVEAEQLVASLRSQLAMQGLSLGSLRLNGESLWQQGGNLARIRSAEESPMNEAITNTMEMNNVG